MLLARVVCERAACHVVCGLPGQRAVSVELLHGRCSAACHRPVMIYIHIFRVLRAVLMLSMCLVWHALPFPPLALRLALR